jgi:hypothetical protein
MVTNIAETVQETVDEALEDIASVEDVRVQYCLSTSSSTFIQDGDWSNTPPAYQANRYYWTRTVIEDEDGNEAYGTPQYSQDTQLSVETSRAYATTDAHFWYDSTGAYVTNATKTDYKASASNKYATRVTPTGILQSYSGNLLTAWTNSGIGVYAGDGTTADNSTKLAQFGTSGMNVYASGTSVASFGSVVRLGATTNASYTEVNATGLDVKDTSSGDKLSVDASGISGFVGSNLAWGIDTYTPTVGTNYGIYIRSRAGQSITIKDNISLNGTVHIDAVEPTSLFNVTSTSLDQYEGLTGSGNIAGSTTVTNGGYYPLGVVGLSIATGGTYSRGAYLSNESTGSCTVNIRVYNTGSGSVTATAYILWVAA